MLSAVLHEIATVDNIRMSNPISLFCCRYEQEINMRNDAENEFVMLKKVKHAATMAIIDNSQFEL